MLPSIDGGRNLLTPVYAGDIAEWIMRALERPESGGHVFNAVGPDVITKERYYRIIGEIIGKDARLVTVPSRIFREIFPSMPQYVRHRSYSCRKVSEMLDYAPRFDALDMLKETVEFMLEHDLVKDCTEEPIDDQLVDLILQHESDIEALLAEHRGERENEGINEV